MAKHLKGWGPTTPKRWCHQHPCESEDHVGVSQCIGAPQPKQWKHKLGIYVLFL